MQGGVVRAVTRNGCKREGGWRKRIEGWQAANL